MPTGERDIEKIYSTAEVAAKLRRLADSLDQGNTFRIQVAGERVRVPARAEFSIEHERGEDEEEIEFPAQVVPRRRRRRRGRRDVGLTQLPSWIRVC